MASEYQKMVAEEAKSFLETVASDYDDDKGEFGGKSDAPNFPKWLDRTRKLLDRIDEVSKGWGRLEAQMVAQNSRNAVQFGSPKESAYFAYHKDVMQELKKLRKK
ncbi:MAG: hypothetical protein AAF581_21715 [Planctomycetota bacterium]